MSTPNASAPASASASARVPLSIESVPVYPSPGYLPSGMEREGRLLDVDGSGVPVFETEQARLSAQVERLWAERGDFSKFSAGSLRKRKSSSGSSSNSSSSSSTSPPSSPAPAPARASADVAQERKQAAATIRESEFASLRADVLARLDMAHYNAIHAHQLLGMLLSTGSEFLLDPSSVGLSRGAAAAAAGAGAVANAGGEEEEEEEEDSAGTRAGAGAGMRSAVAEVSASAATRLHDLKVSLASKRAAVSSAAALLRRGAEELRSTQQTERDRWRLLRAVHADGWRLTPGRPLLDIERGRDLRGFGMPVFSVSQRADWARDAWIGFAEPEHPLAMRRRGLAYVDEHARIVVPERPQPHPHGEGALRVEVRTRSGTILATSSPSPSPGPDQQHAAAGELRHAQQLLHDHAVFASLTHQARLTPHATVSAQSVQLPLSPGLVLCYRLAPTATDADADAEAERGEQRYSALATLALAHARLAPLTPAPHPATTRAGDVHAVAASLPPPTPAAPPLTVLGSLTTVLRFAAFTHSLRALLARRGLTHSLALDKPPLPNLHSPALAATLTVLHKHQVIATASLRHPAHMLVHFPLKRTPNGLGVWISLDPHTFDQLLEREMDKIVPVP